jgi:hypothetical protein
MDDGGPGKDPHWLSTLHWRDQAAARRIMDQHGAAAFNRIAKAATTERRPAHRPGQPLGQLLARAAFEWLTHPEWNEADAAKQVARRIVAENAWEGIQPLSESYLRRQLREQLQEATPQIMDAAMELARKRGCRTRFDPPAVPGPYRDWRHLPETLRDLAARLAPLLKLRWPSTALPTFQVRQEVPLKLPTREEVETLERVVHLIRALAPYADHMTVTQLRALLVDIQQAIRRDRGA